MEFLQYALQEKLQQIEQEKERWTKYKDENLQADRNLKEFRKSLEIDVLVPVGSKAFFPGKLYHCNEVLVGMCDGYFPKTSVHTALEICQHRLKRAEQQLEALETEHKMYKDRLELPFDESAAFGSSAEQQEIIEEYNEEEEIQWRQKHKISVREQKKREAEERQRLHNETDDKDIMAILENAELLEELENDLENLGDENEVNNFFQTTTSNESQSIEQTYSENTNVENWLRQTELDDNAETDQSDDEPELIFPQAFLDIRQKAKEFSFDEKLTFYQKHLDEINLYLKNSKSVSYKDVDEYTEKRNIKECLVNAIAEFEEDKRRTKVALKSNNKESGEQAIQGICKKRQLRAEFDELEKTYKDRSKSEQLIFYKSQLRSLMKLIASCTKETSQPEIEMKRDLYEYIVDCIDQLRDKINIEKMAKLEERFVDDDTDNDDANINDGDGEGNIANVDEKISDCEIEAINEKESESPKRKICFAPEPSVTTYHLDDEPWCLQNEKNKLEVPDTAFQFFNSPCSSSSASSVCDNDDDDDVFHHQINDENNQSLMKNKNTNISQSINMTSKSTINICDDVINSEYKSSTTIENNDYIRNNEYDSSNEPMLILKFSHSANVFKPPPPPPPLPPPQCGAINNADFQINSPIDIYRKFGDQNNQINDQNSIGNSTSSNENHAADLTRNCKNKTIPLKNSNQHQLNPNFLSERMKAITQIPGSTAEPKKSILKNKQAVEVEIHGKVYEEIYEDIEDEIYQTRPDPLTAFNTVMGDIIEKKVTNGFHKDKLDEQHDDVSSNVIENDSGNKKFATVGKKRVSLFKLNSKSQRDNA